MTLKVRSTCAASLILAASTLTAHAGSVSVYLSAPFTETAGSSGLNTSDGTATGTSNNPNTTPNTLGIAGTSTEPFSQTAATYKTLTSSAIGATFATTGTGFSILANDQYGAGNQGNYLGVNPANPTTITFTSPVGYFGLLWCAVDSGNNLSLYDQNNALLGTFNSSSFTQILGASTTVTALNGKTYNTADYNGQPTGTNAATPTLANRQNNGERYAFLNFVGTGGTTISKIVETETGATFESDNYAVRSTAPTVDKNNNNSLVFVSAVPEPSAWAMIVAAAGLLLMTVGRRRRPEL